MSHLFTVIFYQPILNLLIVIYNSVSFHDLGVAIIILTAIIRFALWPLNKSSIKSQKALNELQPKMEELKKQYKDDKVALSQATMNLYKDNKINPFSSCLPLLIQLPFLWAVYRVFRDGVDNKLDLVYSFVSKPEAMNLISFGFLNLGKPNVYLAVLAGVAQFVQAKMMMTKQPPLQSAGSKDENMAAIMNKQMLYFMPAITIFIGISLPGGLTLYWLVLTLITALQQLVIFKGRKDNRGDGIIEGQLAK